MNIIVAVILPFLEQFLVFFATCCDDEEDISQIEHAIFFSDDTDKSRRIYLYNVDFWSRFLMVLLLWHGGDAGEDVRKECSDTVKLSSD